MEKTPIGRNLLLGFSIFAPGGIIYLGLKGKGSIDERKNELNDYNELNLKNSENLKNGQRCPNYIFSKSRKEVLLHEKQHFPPNYA